MIERYSLEEMRLVWSDENKFAKWLEVEKAVSKSQARLGIIPKEAADDIFTKSRFDIRQIEKIEKKTNHDVIAFLTDVSAHLGDSAKYLHYGLTSSDVGDTALSLQVIDSFKIIENKVINFIELLKEKALLHKDVVMVGRTHGIHAEPTTLGLKFSIWAFEMNRNFKRLLSAKEVIGYGKISGAVGTYANTSPELEEMVCSELGLKHAEASNQVLQRDRHAEVLCSLAITAATLEKIALEVRHLQRTDVKELEEPFAKGQKGSSAMPHKKNPILCERICGLARVIRSNAMTSFENIALWHERDISHSSAERVILPDSFMLLDYLLEKIMFVIGDLKVFAANMDKNLMKYGGIIFSQRVLLELVKSGFSREEAYLVVQQAALDAWNEEGSFKENILANEKIASVLGPDKINSLFDVKYHLTYVDDIIKRLENI
jgi:adenylosuccinate lyase